MDFSVRLFAGAEKNAPVPLHGTRAFHRFVVPPKFSPQRGPLVLLLRGARRGCFHPRSLAVLTCSLPQRAFSRWRVSLAAAVYRLLLRGLHGYSLLYAISRPVSSPRGDKILEWGLLPVGDGVPDVPL